MRIRKVVKRRETRGRKVRELGDGAEKEQRAGEGRKWATLGDGRGDESRRGEEVWENEME